MVFTVWSGVTYASTCLVKWSWKTKTLVTLGDWFSSNVVSILVKSTCKRSRGVVATIGHKGALGCHPHIGGSIYRPWQLVSSAWPFLATRSILATGIGYGHSLDVLHLNGTHSRQQSSASLAPQRVTDPHSPLLGWSAGKGCLGG